jgi:phosphonate transport system substrate-binding protein
MLSLSLVLGEYSAKAEVACDSHINIDNAIAYKDDNCDFLADTPTSQDNIRDPQTLVWAYAPIEDPSIYARLFKPFTLHLEECVGRQIVYYPVQSDLAQVHAMRTGRLHFAGFSTGTTVQAVRTAGAHPFAAKGSTQSGIRGYKLVAIVRADSSLKHLSELKGRRVAHTTPGSNSGNLAARAYFPREGLTPDLDYVPIMSGGHDRSILGVLRNDYDMAAVASDVLDRMIERGTIDRSDFRVIFESPLFPTSSFAHAHDLAPDLVEKLKFCFFNFKFEPQMRNTFNGDERFLPITYKRDWKAVRDVKDAGADPMN